MLICGKRRLRVIGPAAEMTDEALALKDTAKNVAAPRFSKLRRKNILRF
jgi:hypothetical protein